MPSPLTSSRPAPLKNAVALAMSKFANVLSYL
jgi:hypothetical protein